MKPWDYNTTTSNIYRLPHHLGLSLQPEIAYSHRGRLKNAIDLALPIGTPVYAALDGIVKKAVDGFEDDGRTERKYLPKANLVVIEHRNNEYSVYAHLMRNSVTVTAAQVVKPNQLIGRVGLSGYTSFPHLHFEVFLHNFEFNDPTLLVKFMYRNGIFTLRSVNNNSQSAVLTLRRS